jgi:hypothetical protein
MTEQTKPQYPTEKQVDEVREVLEKGGEQGLLALFKNQRCEREADVKDARRLGGR